MTFATAVTILFNSFVYRTNVYWTDIHGIKRKPHLSVVWNWYHFVAIAILHQPRPTDSADINTRLQLSNTSSIPPMHGGFLLISSHWANLIVIYAISFMHRIAVIEVRFQVTRKKLNVGLCLSCSLPSSSHVTALKSRILLQHPSYMAKNTGPYIIPLLYTIQAGRNNCQIYYLEIKMFVILYDDLHSAVWLQWNPFSTDFDRPRTIWHACSIVVLHWWCISVYLYMLLCIYHPLGCNRPVAQIPQGTRPTRGGVPLI